MSCIYHIEPEHRHCEFCSAICDERGIQPGGVDVEALCDAARALVGAVEGYVMPKKGDKYVFRNEVLARCKELKDLLK